MLRMFIFWDGGRSIRFVLIAVINIVVDLT